MQLEVGSIAEGKVTGITKFGAFVDLGDGVTGLVHISEVAPTFVKEVSDHLQEGQSVKVKVLQKGEDGKISLSIKKAMELDRAPQKRPPYQKGAQRDREPIRKESKPADPNAAFEEMMNKFKQTSEEKMSDLKRSMESKHGGFSRKPNRNY